MDKLTGRATPVRRALLVAISYLLAGILWIILSDVLVESWFSDPAMLTRSQTWKGWGFVLVTALVLFLVLRRQLGRDREQLRLQHDQREEIHRLSQFQRSVIDNANIWINVLDSGGRVRLWNPAAEQISGYAAEEVLGSARIWEWLYPDPDYRREVMDLAGRILAGEQEVEGFETRIRTRSGQERLIAWNSRALNGVDESCPGSIAIGLDVTERRIAEKALKDRERQLATLMDNLPGMAYRCLYDPFWTMKFVSSGCLDLTGYQPAELVDNRVVAFADLIRPGNGEQVLRAVEQAIGTAEPFSIEYQIVRKDGRSIWVWERGRAVDEQDGLMLEGIILDITDRKQLEAELSELATRDPLTGLCNRRETERVLEEEISRAQRYGRKLAVLWIDLDHFKQVNDGFGHATGDEALRTVSARLAGSIRQVDTMGRYGGEEFIVVLPEMDAAAAADTAERLRHRVEEEPVVTADNQALTLTVSIGVAVYPDNGDSVVALCEAADKAMYRAKGQGRNRSSVAVFDGL